MLVIDTINNVTAHLNVLKHRGVTAIGRYYSSKAWKRLTGSEATSVIRAGMLLFTIFEDDGDPKLTVDNGLHHAQIAAQQAHFIGQPEESAIYFALEHLPGGYTRQHLSSVDAYLRGVGDGLKGEFKVGVYSDGVVCDAALTLGLCEYTWLSASSSFEGSREFYVSRRWSLAQSSQIDEDWGGLKIDVNEAAAHYGAFSGPVVAEMTASAARSDSEQTDMLSKSTYDPR